MHLCGIPLESSTVSIPLTHGIDPDLQGIDSVALAAPIRVANGPHKIDSSGVLHWKNRLTPWNSSGRLHSTGRLCAATEDLQGIELPSPTEGATGSIGV